jgi:hypothetical protein
MDKVTGGGWDGQFAVIDGRCLRGSLLPGCRFIAPPCGVHCYQICGIARRQVAVVDGVLPMGARNSCEDGAGVAWRETASEGLSRQPTSGWRAIQTRHLSVIAPRPRHVRPLQSGRPRDCQVISSDRRRGGAIARIDCRSARRGIAFAALTMRSGVSERRRQVALKGTNRLERHSGRRALPRRYEEWRERRTSRQ